MAKDFWDYAEEYVPLAGPAVSLLSGLFGKSAETQYNEAQQRNLERSIAAIRANAQIQRARAQRFATQQGGIAAQSGGRRAAYLGAASDPSVFTDPDISRIRGDLNESLMRIGEGEQANIADVTAGVRDMPSYMFPRATDYLSNALTSAGQFFTGRSQRKFMEDLENRRLGMQNDWLSSLGRTGWTTMGQEGL